SRGLISSPELCCNAQGPHGPKKPSLKRWITIITDHPQLTRCYSRVLFGGLVGLCKLQGSSMPEYRIYTIAGDGHVWSAEDIEYRDDQEAIQKAHRIIRG